MMMLMTIPPPQNPPTPHGTGKLYEDKKEMA
jgi:hypothetical protein